MGGNGRKDRVQGSDSKRIVCWYGYSVGRWLLGLQDHVAPNLIDLPVFPVFAEMPNRFFSAQIARQFHATASTSSRTNRNRIVAGDAESK